MWWSESAQQCAVFVIIFVLAVAVGYLLSKRWIPSSSKKGLSLEDEEAAKRVISTFDKEKAFDLSDEEFQSIKDRILIAGVPASEAHSKENYSYYYDWPNWKFDVLGEPSLLPAGLFSRFYPLYASNNTSGYYWSVRDGVHPQLRSPFGRWTTNNSKYYYVASY